MYTCTLCTQWETYPDREEEWSTGPPASNTTNDSKQSIVCLKV